MMKKNNNEDEDGLEDWEIKLLDDENQPEFHDILEVLSLKDNINKIAKASIIVYIVLGISNFQTIHAFIGSMFSSIEELPAILWGILITAIGIGINLAIVYFPLKALNHILRILMEMEFNSRKAKS
jgi:hypothetical protein